MSSISSSSAYSVSASNNGISGLASGMDTDSMVEKMLSGTQSKINKQEGIKQQLTWKQEMYHDVITEINSFKSKYIDTAFDSTLSGNLANADFFNTMMSSVTGGSQYLKIISSSPEAAVGDMNVIVKRLASTAKLTPAAGNEKLSKNQIKGKINLNEIADNFQSKKVSLTVGNTKVDVDLSGLSASTDIIARLNDALKEKGADATAKLSNGRVSITSGNKNTQIRINGDDSTEWGLQVLGMSKDAVSSETSANAQALTGTSSPNATAGVTFDVNLNGVNKTISIDPQPTGANGEITKEDVQKAFGQAIARAFGGQVTDAVVPSNPPGGPNQANIGNVTGGYINVTFDDDGNLLMEASDPLDQITITGASSKTLGILPGSTNRVTTATKLGDLSDNINGGAFKFSINGVDFSFSEDDTLGTMINKINSSAAGVKLSYSSLSDSISLEANSSGERFGIDITQTEGNLLTALFGKSVINAAPTVGSKRLTTGQIQGTSEAVGNESMTNPTFSLNVNGESYSFSLQGTFNVSAAIADINEKLKEKFGDAIQIDNNNNLIIKDGSYVTFDQSTVDLSNADAVAKAKQSDLAFILGLNTSNKNNAASASTKIDDLSLTDAEKNDLKALANGRDTLGDISATGLKFENGRFVADATAAAVIDGPPANTALRTLFKLQAGENFIDLVGDGKMADGQVVKGTDALVSINGIDVTRSSNTFTVDGITMQLTKAMVPDNAASTNLFVDDRGNLVDQDNNRVNENGQVFDRFGNLLEKDTDGNYYVVNNNGQRLDQQGRTLQKAGDGNYYVVNNEGHFIDNNGDRVDPVNGWKVDIAGNPITTPGGGNVVGYGVQSNPITGTPLKGDLAAGATPKPITATYNNVDPVTISTSRDIDSIVDTLKDFVKDYNAMLDKLNGYVYADANYRKYDPLTSEQKKEMSEKEIELWEEKAKEGLLRNDGDISYFLSQMRIALYTKPASSNFALYDIGIDTSTYSDRGKLTFNETALRKALSDDPESVKNLFTDPVSGIARQMASIVDQTAKISSASPGTLVQTAGAKGTKIKSTDNDIATRIKELETKIKDLKSKYETERQRYWKMFTNMETNLSNLNSQSSWLYQQFSSGQ